MICEAFICGKHRNRINAYVNIRKLKNIQPLAHDIRVEIKRDAEGRTSGPVKYHHTKGCIDGHCDGHDTLSCEAITNKDTFCKEPATYVIWYFPDEQAKILNVNPAAITFSLPMYVATNEMIYLPEPKMSGYPADEELKQIVCLLARDTMSMRQIEVFLKSRNVNVDHVSILRFLREKRQGTIYKK